MEEMLLHFLWRKYYLRSFRQICIETLEEMSCFEEDEEAKKLFGLDEIDPEGPSPSKEGDYESGGSRVSATWSQWSARIAPRLEFPIHITSTSAPSSSSSSTFSVSIKQNDKGYGELGTRVW